MSLLDDMAEYLRERCYSNWKARDLLAAYDEHKAAQADTEERTVYVAECSCGEQAISPNDDAIAWLACSDVDDAHVVERVAVTYPIRPPRPREVQRVEGEVRG